MPALPLTPEQKADANRLKQLFQAWQADRKRKGEPSNQDAISESLGFGQSALSQYLNGKIPLNPAAAAKFARLLGCQISDFSAPMAALASEIAAATTPTSAPATLSKKSIGANELEAQLLRMFREMSPEHRDELLQHANMLHNQAKPEKSRANPFAGVPGPASEPKTKPTKAPAKTKRTEGAEH